MSFFGLIWKHTHHHRDSRHTCIPTTHLHTNHPASYTNATPPPLVASPSRPNKRPLRHESYSLCLVLVFKERRTQKLNTENILIMTEQKRKPEWKFQWKMWYVLNMCSISNEALTCANWAWKRHVFVWSACVHLVIQCLTHSRYSSIYSTCGVNIELRFPGNVCYYDMTPSECCRQVSA